MVKVVVIDNYDSFAYNLVQYLGELGEEGVGGGDGRVGFDVLVYRNDAVDVETLEEVPPAAIVISPGPGTPDDAGVGLEVIRRLGPRIPILGVCLGHQCIGAAYGGVVRRGAAPVHGKVSRIFHDGRTIFEGVPSPFEATRYHSLIVERDSLPPVLEASAHLEDGTVMGLRHREYLVEGVQFHPESILTLPGKQILRNFLRMARVGVEAEGAPVSSSGKSFDPHPTRPR
ncbi:MAG: glutamine amidotransferase of anthranilate synthase, anthranilate synthase component II [Armatimonadetes bacterium CSP1-3]|nr:MAG: glutamine amidotransferase of anthranilate synthase, anthranilate synthase component II [Armatimonadetes bacterium CSP1-3]